MPDATPPGVVQEPVWGVREPLASGAEPPVRAEVVVVGGGITGVSVLRGLRERGVDCVLLEAEHIAHGASGRNAGFLLAGVSENYARAVHDHGRDVARAVWAFTSRNHELVAAQAVMFDSGYRQVGSLVVALDAEEAASLEEAATLLAEDGFPGRLCVAGPVPDAVRTLHNPEDGEVDPVRLVRGLVAPCGGAVFEGCRVTALEDSESGVTVHHERGAVLAETVVLATNAWTGELAPSVPIRPVRAQMLATEPCSPAIERPVYAEWGHRYWRQRADGRVLVGGFRHRALAEEVGFDTRPTSAVQRHLDTQLVELGVTARVSHRWAGTMGFSSDGLPLAGLVPGTKRTHVCAGYTGHGMGFAVHAADVLCRHLLDGVPLPVWLSAGRDAAS